MVDDACKAIDAQSVMEAEGQAVAFRKITMNDCEGIAVGCWFNSGGDAPQDMEAMFKRADENEDGSLSYEEFAKLMGDIKPDLGLLKTLSIFREAIAESSSFEGDVITPDAFARVMSSHNITMPVFKRPDEPEDESSTGFQKEAFKIDYVLLEEGFMDQFYLTLTKMFGAGAYTRPLFSST